MDRAQAATSKYFLLALAFLFWPSVSRAGVCGSGTLLTINNQYTSRPDFVCVGGGSSSSGFSGSTLTVSDSNSSFTIQDGTLPINSGFGPQVTNTLLWNKAKVDGFTGGGFYLSNSTTSLRTGSAGQPYINAPALSLFMGVSNFSFLSYDYNNPFGTLFFNASPSSLTSLAVSGGNDGGVLIGSTAGIITKNGDIYDDGTVFNVGREINNFGNAYREVGNMLFENGAEIGDSDLPGTYPLYIKPGTESGSYIWLDGGVKLDGYLEVVSTEVHHSTAVFQGPILSTNTFHFTGKSTGTFDGAVTFGSSVTFQGPIRSTGTWVQTSSITVQGIFRASGPLISTNTFLTASLQTSTITLTGSDVNGNALVTNGGCIKIGATTPYCGPGNCTYAP